MRRFFIACVLAVGLSANGHAQQNQASSGVPSKLVKIRDDLFMIENINATVADIGSYGATRGGGNNEGVAPVPTFQRHAVPKHTKSKGIHF